MAKKLWLAVALLWLVGCQPVNPVIPTEPNPEVVTIQITPGLVWMLDSISVCAQENPGLGLVVDTVPAANQDLSAADMLLRWDAPPQQNPYTYELGQEELLLVVNPQNPLSGLRQKEVVDLFSGNIRTWEQVLPGSSLGEVSLRVYSEQNEAWVLFEKSVFFTTRPFFGALLVPDPQTMREEIALHVNSLGLLPARWLDDSVKAVAIQDLAEGMKQPIIAELRGQPTGNLHELLLCLGANAAP